MRRRVKNQVENDQEPHQKKKMAELQPTLGPKRMLDSYDEMVKRMPYLPEPAVQSKAASAAARIQSLVDLSAFAAEHPQGGTTAVAEDIAQAIDVPANRAGQNLLLRRNHFGKRSNHP